MGCSVSHHARSRSPAVSNVPLAARLEIAGPHGRGRGRGVVRGGVDLRGDGSAEAFTGRLRRAVVERRDGESASQALARALST